MNWNAAVSLCSANSATVGAFGEGVRGVFAVLFLDFPIPLDLGIGRSEVG